MGFKVDYDALDAHYASIATQVGAWQGQLEDVAEAIVALAESHNMSGAGAENIRTYLKTVHGSIEAMLAELISLHVVNDSIYQMDYMKSIDSDAHAVIEESELEDLVPRFERQNTRAKSVYNETVYALSGIRDIFYLSYPDVGWVDGTHRSINTFMQDLCEEVNALEAAHEGSDFSKTEEMIASLGAFIQEMTAKGRSYLTSFDPQSLAGMESFRRLYAAHLDIQGEIESRSQAFEEAEDLRQQRIATIQAEIEERERKAKVVNWIVTGVCVVGSVAAIALTGGAATPLVVGGISACSGAIMAGTRNLTSQYVQNGDLGSTDWLSFGKDVLVGGVTGFVTGYVGASVGGAVTSWLSNNPMASSLLNSSNALVRVGTGAAIGSVSEVSSGILSRGAGTFIASGGDLQAAMNDAFDGQSILVDAVTGGVSGGISNAKKPDKYENAIKDGSQFDEDGNLKPDVTYQSGEHDYYYTTDEEGRIVEVHADELEMKTHDGRLNHNPNTPDKQAGDQAGHLIGDRFGGSPDIDNLTSQDGHLNQGDYKVMENEWAAALEQDKSVSVDIHVNYDGGGARPSSYDVSYTIDGEQYNVTFPN